MEKAKLPSKTEHRDYKAICSLKKAKHGEKAKLPTKTEHRDYKAICSLKTKQKKESYGSFFILYSNEDIYNPTLRIKPRMSQMQRILTDFIKSF